MADFKFYLNRQGPKGEPGTKGEKGDNGNTPTFSDGINTPTVYTMQIDMGDGNVFETQNLKYPMRDDGGNYLRYDRTNSTVTLSAPNIADLQRTSGEVTLASVSDVENEDAQDTDAVSMELRNADQLALNNEINRIDRDIDTVNDKVDREIQNRQDADTQLTNKINTDVGNEATARSNADAALSGKIDGLDSSKANKSDVYTKTQTDTLLSGKANTLHTHSLSQITDAGSLAGKNTVDYTTEVTNKPTIGDGTITITQGGVTKGTFTTNQSGNSTVELDAGGGGGATYTEGPGITIGENNEISVNYDSAQALFTNASTGALGVNVDGTTVVVDDNALKANINDATITITQGGVVKGTFTTNQALANTIALDGGITYTSGKAIEIDQNNTINLKTSIINAPLAYQNETGTDVKFQNRNIERYNGSLAGNGYNDSYWIINYGTSTTYLNSPDVNFSNLLNSSSTIYAETRLTNGVNISGTLSKGLNSTDLAYISLLGRYEQDESFTIVAAIGLNTFYDPRTYVRFFNNGNDVTGLTTSNYQYNDGGGMYGYGGAKYYAINCSSTNLTIASMSSPDGSTTNTGNKRTVTISNQLKNALDTVTHIRVYPVNYNNSSNYVTLNEDFLKVINPVENVTTGGHSDRFTIFNNGNNIFEAIPEAIKLKYDSTTLGVNANNELTVPTATTSNLGLVKPDGTTVTINNGVISAASSTPSNMVTTDTTSQTFEGDKELILKSTNNSNKTLKLTDSRSSNWHIDFSVRNSNNESKIIIQNDNLNYTTIGHNSYGPFIRVRGAGANENLTYEKYNAGSSITSYLIDTSMIDGTTITYNSSTGKISASANPPIATSSSTGVVQPDNSTITVDGNGVISAVNNSIAKTAPIIPLKYEEQEDGISVGIGGTLNHTNYTSSADEVWVSDASTTGIYNMSGDGYIYQSAANMMSKIFYRGYKIRLDNGLNIAWNIAEGSGFFMNVAVGYYDNGTFVPVLYALNTSSYGGSMFARPALEIASDVYDMGRLNTQFTSCVGISLLGDVLSAFSPSTGRHTYTISDTTLLTELQKCTHAICTVINESSTGTTFNYSTGKFANPATTLSDDLEVRNTIFSAAENLILNTDTTVVPELKLNCDSTYFKVVNNQLTLDIQAIKDAIDALT